MDLEKAIKRLPKDLIDKYNHMYGNRIRQEYNIYKIKQGTKIRTIEEPKSELKELQKRILGILELINLPAACMSKPGMSTLDNAEAHQGANLIYKVDIKDFYPSTTSNHIQDGMMYLQGIGFYECSPSYDYILHQAISCCYIRKLGMWRLPTGAPTSPYLSNIAMAQTDIEFTARAESGPGTVYTRYFDDLTFSSMTNSTQLWRRAITEDMVADHLESMGYEINKKKTGWVSPNHAKPFEVTGVRIQPGQRRVPKYIRRIVRVILDKQAAGKPINPKELEGYLAYVNMLDENVLDELKQYSEERKIFYAEG